MKNEKQVLILVKSMISDITGDSFDNKSITDQLSKISYTEHHFQKHDNNSAAAWVEHHMTRQEDDVVDEKFKFLIGNWYTAAGFEVVKFYDKPEIIDCGKASLRAKLGSATCIASNVDEPTQNLFINSKSNGNECAFTMN